MQINIYAFRDAKSENLTIPFYMQNDAMAQRAFADMVNDPEHQFGKNPEDYTLVKLGTYDDNDGTLYSDMEIVTDGLDLIRR